MNSLLIIGLAAVGGYLLHGILARHESPQQSPSVPPPSPRSSFRPQQPSIPFPQSDSEQVTLIGQVLNVGEDEARLRMREAVTDLIRDELCSDKRR